MPHMRSSWASPLVSGSGLRAQSPGLGLGSWAAEQEERHRPDPAPPAWRSAGNVLNLSFQGWFLPLLQRVSEWQAISVI